MEMEKSFKQPKVSSSVVAKAGIWYTICNFLFKGMAFLTTPVFARLLTKEELGSFTNFSSWISILMVITSFDLAQSIIRSKLEHEDDIDCYIWSILSFSTITTLLMYGIVCLFHNFFVEFFDIEMKYIHVMFLYLLVSPAYQMLITKHRAFYRYKMFVIITGITIAASVILSLVMVIIMEDKLAGRIVGHYLPYILMGGSVFILLAYRGKRIKVNYWKYACVICLPLVPHVLSMYLLNSSDKILLTKFHGEEYTAIYGIACSCYYIATTLLDSMNKAWAPWLLDSLHQNNYTDIRKVSKIYIGIFALLIVGILMVVPELILILGGKQYVDAIGCLPALIVSCMFQFIYTMYVNIEFYKKKTFAVAGATAIATLVNILLDLYLFPRFRDNCYVIAGYTTLLGFAVLLVLHYLLVRRMHLTYVYDTRFIIAVLVGVLLFAAIIMPFYRFTWIRYILVLVYGGGLLLLGYKNKTVILGIFKKNK